MTTALLVVDMLSRYEHDDAELLAESALEAVPNIRRMLDAAGEQGSPRRLVNDNHGTRRSTPPSSTISCAATPSIGSS
ncbi:hypothetical protein GCM10011575_32870 [Microlunatus endophyticus]|uniref:Uncharacterized protein n=1 Tax=Microlunatus endophyticus TaxID=1716077 RepID=A0A917W5S8_9ACTN|nr:hypothetical protein [Microlunatus endophyticus]GGL71959.1 hypothetical protein GCM10011575_32870 [Microlunatus endophyticus]